MPAPLEVDLNEFIVVGEYLNYYQDRGWQTIEVLEVFKNRLLVVSDSSPP
jgi:hypothetical protein